ncbi:MAG: hypothetical protein HOC74_43310 [Gemmatimonadetes bacterium]|jgi:hypothetical protein|nr:hypothetical protein [Gemmatimonadota bacterium]
MKRTVPFLIASIAGFVLIFAYFIPYAEGWGESVSIWFDVLAAIAFILGGGNLLKVHIKKISKQEAGWAYSGITVAAFAITLFVGLTKLGAHPNAQFPDASHWTGQYREVGTSFWWIYQYAFVPLTATIFSLLAFYVASAAFRAFRARNTEAILLLGTAVIILLGRTFAGVYLTGWLPDEVAGLRIENLTVDIMRVFNTAGNRAIMIGIALGTASVSLKILLGVDRSYLGSGDD